MIGRICLALDTFSRIAALPEPWKVGILFVQMRVPGGTFCSKSSELFG